MKKILSLVPVAALWLAPLTASADPLKIVAAENFYGGVAQQIAGSDATVTSILVNPNQDPHEFTSNAETAKAVADADIVIYSGISYDPWMDKLLATGGKPGRVVIKVSDLIGAKEGDNPHIWYDPRTMPALVTKIVEVLSKIDSSQVGDYQKRQAIFTEQMKLVSAQIAQIKAEAPGLKVTATEPVFGYMADALGFKMVNYDFQLRIMNDSEPTAAETAEFDKSLNSVKILFYNSQVTDPTTDRMQKLAKSLGVAVIGVTETQPLDQKFYSSWMSYELSQIGLALQLQKNTEAVQ